VLSRRCIELEELLRHLDRDFERMAGIAARQRLVRA